VIACDTPVNPKLPALLTLSPLLLGGCGATTLRLDLAPTIDSSGSSGFESTLSLGLGIPVDVKGDRSHHFKQVMGSLGGGVDTRDASGTFISAASLTHLYWSEPSLDIRSAVRYAYRVPVIDSGYSALHGVGLHLAILPVVDGDPGGSLVSQFCLGPELRIEGVWSDSPEDKRALFSLPLVAELTLLMPGE
jgi:hypothetical protein